MPRHLPPVYSPQSFGTICAAAAQVGMGRGALALQAAREALAARFPGYDVRLTGSGTGALSLALGLALDRANAQGLRTRTVALPAYCCPDVGTAAVAVQAGIALYDVDPHTLEPDWATLARALDEGAAVVVITHLYGRVIDLQPAHDLAARYGAVVIEDAAQHAGGTVNGQRGGSQGTLGVLSFGRGKGLNAGGGGALLCRRTDRWPDTSLPGATRGGGALLQAALAELLSHPQLYGVPARIPALGLGSTVYHAPQGATSMPMTVAALLIGALNGEPAALAHRRRLEQWYEAARRARTPHDVQYFPPCEGSGALRTPVLLDPARADITALNALGVVRSYPRTLAAYAELQPLLRPADRSWPGAQVLAERMHTLPTHVRTRDADVRQICALLNG